jgi:2-haloacid dehalogenase
MTERWATFDCYGTLIDWYSGIRGVIRRLWPEADVERLLRRHHALEPLVQEGRSISYREVGARTLRAMAAVEGLPLAAAEEFAFADSLPSWTAFPEVPNALRQLRDNGWRLAILSNTDPPLLEASIVQLGVPIDLSITAAEAGSYKPAHGHWRRFFESTHVPVRQHAHVGASAFHDLAPCHELGLTAVWINRLQESTNVPRAAELPDLQRLPETLERLVRQST